MPGNSQWEFWCVFLACLAGPIFCALTLEAVVYSSQGNVTEESMSRHVTKCMQKLFSTPARNGKVPSNRTADSFGMSLPVGKRGHRVLSVNAREKRKRSCEQRAASILAVLAGDGRQALVDMVLASSV